MITRTYHKPIIYSLMLSNWEELRVEIPVNEYKNAPIDGPIYYLLHTIDGVVTGVFMCISEALSMDIHAAFKREFRGKVSINAAKECFKWIFDHTEHKKITADIASDRKNVKTYASLCGMSFVNGRFEVAL
jgi:hypothetical protein